MLYVIVILTGALFAAAAMRTSKVASLHLLAIWVYFSALPALSSLISNDRDLGQAMVDHGYLPILYLLGVLMASSLRQDSTTSASLLERLQQVRNDPRGHMALQLLFIAVFATDFMFRLFYDILGSGTRSDSVALNLPYHVTTVLFITSKLLFGLFCYTCLTVRLSNIAKLLVATFMLYMLISDGRRSFLLTAIVLVSLGQGNFRFHLTPRIVGIMGILSVLFVAITPIFLEFRNNLQDIQLIHGETAMKAFPEAIGNTFSSLQQTASGSLSRVSENIAGRGNAGVFFFRVAQSIPFYQGGAMVMTSFEWLIPSVFIMKPEAYPETLIQYASGLPVIDDAISIPTIFLADFGPIGVLMAGFVTTLFLYAVAKSLARPRRFGLLEVYLLGTLFAQSIEIETELSDFLAFFRDVVIIIILGWAWRFAVRKQPGVSRNSSIAQSTSKLR